MGMSIWSRLGAGILCVILGAIGASRVSAQSAATDSGPGVKRALLIGINKYQAVPKLQGSINDIETMRKILLTRWGFPEKHIAILAPEEKARPDGWTKTALGGGRAGIIFWAALVLVVVVLLVIVAKLLPKPTVTSPQE